jgi:pimeloyl-ACP methyl ester carboxylesterase
MGESMGGMNAAMLSLAAPTTFSKVALVCPALFTVGPYSTQEEVEAYIARHQPYILRDKVEQANALGAEEFPTAELYDQHNPILWAQRTQNGFPPYYISMNTRDEYGVHEGASVFADMLRMRGQDPTFVAIVGLGHCYPTPDSIAALTKYLATP